MGLILVIWGHLLYRGTWSIVNQAVYSFHLPMFFALAGVLAKGDDVGFLSFVRKKSYRILGPACLMLLMTLPLYLYSVRNDFHIQTMLRLLFYVDGKVPYNDPVWFFFCIFQVLVVQKFFHLSNQKKLIQIVYTIVAFCLGFLCDKYGFRYFGIDKMFLALGFYTLGVVYRKFDWKPSKVLYCLCLLIVFALWILSALVFNIKVSMYRGNYGSYWLFVVSGCTGSYLWFQLAKAVTWKPIYSEYAGNTAFIVCTHYVGVTVFELLCETIGVEHTPIASFLSLVATFIGLAMYYLICRFINKRIPVLNGRKKLLVQGGGAK